MLVTCLLASETCNAQEGMALQDWKDKLGKDPQKRADPKVFQHSELRELFGAYVHNLRGQIQQGYRSLMDQASNSIMQLLYPTKLHWIMWGTSFCCVPTPFLHIPVAFSVQWLCLPK